MERSVGFEWVFFGGGALAGRNNTTTNSMVKQPQRCPCSVSQCL